MYFIIIIDYGCYGNSYTIRIRIIIMALNIVKVLAAGSKSLSLDNAGLSVLPAPVVRLYSLCSLSAKNNSLSDLPEELANLRNVLNQLRSSDSYDTNQSIVTYAAEFAEPRKQSSFSIPSLSRAVDVAADTPPVR